MKKIRKSTLIFAAVFVMVFGTFTTSMAAKFSFTINRGLTVKSSAVEKKGYLVVGTSNKCELYVGYFTKGGDSVHDIAPIADLTVEEVIQIGEYLHVPAKVLYKTPNDGLSNQTDEQKLGVSYRDIARYMEDPKSVDLVTRGKIERLHQLAAHKFAIPTYYKTDKGAE